MCWWEQQRAHPAGPTVETPAITVLPLPAPPLQPVLAAVRLEPPSPPPLVPPEVVTTVDAARGGADEMDSVAG
jgi:hypothetical protein